MIKMGLTNNFWNAIHLFTLFIGLLAAHTVSAGEITNASRVTAVDKNTPSYCHKSETVIFSCEASTKLLSLCASKDLSQPESYLKFRISKAKLVKEYPPRYSRPNEYFKFFESTFAKGGTEAVSFWEGYKRYSLFSTTSVYGYNGAGLIVNENNKQILFLKCNKSSVFNELSKFLPAAELEDAGSDIDYVPADSE